MKKETAILLILFVVAGILTGIGMHDKNYLMMFGGGLALGGLSMLLFTTWRESRAG